MRWQTLVRLAFGLALIGVAGLIFFQLRERPVTDAPVVAAPISDPTVTREGERGKYAMVDEAGAVIYEIAYEKDRTFADGRAQFEGVTVTFMRDGVPHTLIAPEAQMEGKAGPTGNQPERLFFPKGVRLQGDSGVSVTTDGEATFFNSEQKVVIPGAMTFARGRLSGGGVGADLYMDRSVLWILDQARLSVAPEGEGGTPIEASARRIGLAEMDHYMVLEDRAVLTHQSQRLASQNARVSFTPVGDVVQYIELRGGSSVRSTDPASQRPEMTAENINLEFAPESGRLVHTRLAGTASVQLREAAGVSKVAGSEIEINVGPDGETVTRLQATAPVEVTLPRQGDQPSKTITARFLLAEGQPPGGLDRAVLNGSVDYRESRPGTRGQPATVRTATSEVLTLGLKGDLGQVESATFRQQFTVKDGDLTATADEGTYDAAAERLALRWSGRGARPRVSDPQVDIDAAEIDADLKSDGFDARGGAGRVESFFKPQQGGRQADVGLFEPGQSIAGTSGRLRFTRATGVAVYEGTVYLRQGESSLAADRIELDDRRGDLRASEKVVSRMSLEKPDAQGRAAKPTRVEAASLVYVDAERTATYAGGVTLDSATGERLTAEQVTLLLEAGDRQLKTLEAHGAKGGEVRMRLVDGRQAAGQRLLYDAAAEKYRLFGVPAVIVSPADDQPGMCTVMSGTEFWFNRTGRDTQMLSQGGALGALKTVKCAEVLK